MARLQWIVGRPALHRPVDQIAAEALATIILFAAGLALDARLGAALYRTVANERLRTVRVDETRRPFLARGRTLIRVQSVVTDQPIRAAVVGVTLFAELMGFSRLVWRVANVLIDGTFEALGAIGVEPTRLAGVMKRLTARTARRLFPTGQILATIRVRPTGLSDALGSLTGARQIITSQTVTAGTIAGTGLPFTAQLSTLMLVGIIAVVAIDTTAEQALAALAIHRTIGSHSSIAALDIRPANRSTTATGATGVATGHQRDDAEQEDARPKQAPFPKHPGG